MYYIWGTKIKPHPTTGMTQEGILITTNGESAPEPHYRHQQHLQILFWRKVGSIAGQLIDISCNDDESVSLLKKPAAHLLFFTGQRGDEDAPDTYHNLKGYQHNLILFTNNNLFRQWQNEGHSEILYVRIDIDFLKKYLPRNAAFTALNDKIANNLPGILSKVHLPLTPNISAVLNEILSCRKTGLYRNFYLQAKVIELLVLQFEQFEGQLAVTAKPDKLPMYVEKMNHVRDILLDNLNTELSLKELANQVGTNEFDLKRNFKKVFGNTVFGYLHQHKMEKAKQLLLNANNKVATVAELMGYKYATHFTNAFKKYFGYLPHKLKLLILFPLSEMDSMIPFI